MCSSLFGSHSGKLGILLKYSMLMGVTFYLAVVIGGYAPSAGVRRAMPSAKVACGTIRLITPKPGDENP